jgi:hypothetical protein
LQVARCMHCDGSPMLRCAAVRCAVHLTLGSWSASSGHMASAHLEPPSAWTSSTSTPATQMQSVCHKVYQECAFCVARAPMLYSCLQDVLCRTLHSSRATCNVGVPHSSASLRSCMLVACCNLRAACNRSENVACRSMLHVAGASFMLQRCCTVCCTLMVHVVNAATTHSPFACSTRRYESTSPLAMRVARTKSCI